MVSCGEDCITNGRYRNTNSSNISSGVKAAETRAANTRKEVGFLASAYYDCAQFVFNSGFHDIKIVNSQFGNMLNNYITASKIKRESYNKFMELSAVVSVTKYNKEDYIKAIYNAYNQDTQLSDKFKGGGNKLKNEFRQFIKSTGVNITPAKENIIYLQFLYNIAEATGNSAIKDLADKQRHEMGFDFIDFSGPEMKISDGDGCGHGIIHGNALKHYNQLRSDCII